MQGLIPKFDTSKWMSKRYKYATVILATLTCYTGYQRLMAPTFGDQIRLVFPEFKEGDKKSRTVIILSSNQLQYLLKTCSLQGKHVSPVKADKGLSADVYFDSVGMSKVLKLSEKDAYVKVEPGITLVDLSRHLAPVFQVPLTYPVD